MAEFDRVTFSHKELAEILVKRQNIREGIWGLYVEFGLKATNLSTGADQVPAAVIPLLKVGLQKFDEETNISVDAAKVNPSIETSAGKRTRRATKAKSAKTR